MLFCEERDEGAFTRASDAHHSYNNIIGPMSQTSC